MKSISLYIVALFFTTSFFASCSKEEVKPFNSTATTPFNMRDAEDGVNPIDEDSNPNVSGSDDENSGDGTGGITDGGNSSDYDSSKGRKKANKTN